MTWASLLVAGFSHRTAPVELLGRCVLCGPGAVAALRDRDEIPEVVALSTCNRRELYAVARDPRAARESMAQALADMTGLGLPELWRSLYIHHEEQAARHLFRVASSLDSMVLGESEIQGQVRRAWESAHTDGASGPMLDRLFRRALQVGRRVRRDTRIGAGRVSVPSVAVSLVERAVGSLTDRRVLVVGAGEMARVVADALAARRVPDVVVVSRCREAAAAVAGPRGWRSAALTALGNEIPLADVVISATAPPHILVTAATSNARFPRARDDRWRSSTWPFRATSTRVPLRSRGSRSARWRSSSHERWSGSPPNGGSPRRSRLDICSKGEDTADAGCGGLTAGVSGGTLDPDLLAGLDRDRESVLGR